MHLNWSCQNHPIAYHIKHKECLQRKTDGHDFNSLKNTNHMKQFQASIWRQIWTNAGRGYSLTNTSRLWSMYMKTTCEDFSDTLISRILKVKMKGVMGSHLYVSSTLNSGRFWLSASMPSWYWCSKALYSCRSQWEHQDFWSAKPFSSSWCMIDRISFSSSFHLLWCFSRSVFIRVSTWGQDTSSASLKSLHWIKEDESIKFLTSLTVICTL